MGSGVSKLDVEDGHLSLEGKGLSKLPDISSVKDDVTSLNISSNKIGELPGYLKGNKKIKRLVYNKNGLSEIPDSVSYLEGLTYLEMGENSIKEIPDSLLKLQELETLDLHLNKVQQVPDLSSIKTLAFVYLRANDIHEFPVSLLSVPKITVINLCGNFIKELPTDMKGAPVVTLNLGSNRIERVALSAETPLKELLRLDLSRNRIEDLGDSLRALPALKKLDLSVNRLSEIPDVSPLANLRRLLASHNLLSSIPAGLEGLSKLKHIDLSNNCIKEIRLHTLLECPSLQHLDLSHNKIESLGPAAEGAPHKTLKTLYLDHNAIRELPSDFFEHLRFCEKIDVSHNCLSQLPDVPSECKIRILHLGSNGLKSLPDSFENLSSVTILDLSFNNFSGIPRFIRTYKNLEKLDLSRFGSIESVEEFQGFDGLKNLKILNLSLIRGLDTFPELVCEIPGLSELYCIGNELTVIPVSVFNKINPISLDFSNNKIESLPIDEIEISQDFNLRNFSLASNRLSALSNDLVEYLNASSMVLSCTRKDKVCKNLFLDLSGNNLTEEVCRQVDWNHIRNLNELDLSTNKIRSFDFLQTLSPPITFLRILFNDGNDSAPIDPVIAAAEEISYAFYQDEPLPKIDVDARVKDAVMCQYQNCRLDHKHDERFGVIRMSEKYKESVGFSSMKGRRLEMQDFIHINTNMQDSDGVMMGVFDGHNGEVAARVAALAFSHYFAKFLDGGLETSTPAILNPSGAVDGCGDLYHPREYFDNMDDGDRRLALAFSFAFSRLAEQFDSVSEASGSTATCVYCTGSKVFCAGLGDSRAVLVRTDSQGVPQGVPLSLDHTLYNWREHDSVKERGGWSTPDGRVAGYSALSRSLGDHKISQWISRVPDVAVYSIDSEKDKWEHHVVVIASDGLWDMLSVSQVATICSEHRELSGFQLANLLAKLAFAKGSADNISVVVSKVL